MCRIVGFFGFQDSQLLDVMLDSFKHLESDKSSRFSDDWVSLGVRRLSIVDLKHGQQPLHNENVNIWTVFNGEIYNFRDLRNELIIRGHQFYTDTDTETIIHAYEEWNTNCFKKFNGMFALALWDKERRMLLLARDRLGICPLYYCNFSNRFRFASEIKALLADPRIPRTPNEQILYEYLLNGFQMHSCETFFKGIKQLPAAHYLIVNPKQLVLKRYWKLSASEPSAPASDSEYASKFRDLLLDAIKIRLPLDLEVGYWISGGLDSTTILLLAKNVLKSNPQFRNVNSNAQKIISAVYREASVDERQFIEEASNVVGAKTSYVFPSDSMQWADLLSFVYHMDEPVSVLNYYVYWCLARIAKGHFKIALSGQGPDEFLAGHTDHFIVYLKELWKTRKILTLLLEMLGGLSTYGPISIIQWTISRITLSKRYIEHLLNPQFVVAHKQSQFANKTDSLNASLLLDVTNNRLPMHLRAGDRISSVFSIEFRYPYLDHRLIEFAFSIPKNQKIRKAATKYVLRAATKNLIPESIRKRKKKGTPIPLKQWMKDLRKEVRDVFGSKEFRERGYFNQNAVLDLYDRYCSGKLNRQQREFYGNVLWRILNVELWFRIFFQSPKAALNSN